MFSKVSGCVKGGEVHTPGRHTTPLGRHPPRQTPPGQTHHPQADTPRQTPPDIHPPIRQPLQRKVGILLECILVF